MLAELREDNQRVVASMREAHGLCDEHEDVATASLLENFIDDAEKRVWFLYEAGRRGGPDGASWAFDPVPLNAVAVCGLRAASANASAPKRAKRASAGRGSQRQRRQALP